MKVKCRGCKLQVKLNEHVPRRLSFGTSNEPEIRVGQIIKFLGEWRGECRRYFIISSIDYNETETEYLGFNAYELGPKLDDNVPNEIHIGNFDKRVWKFPSDEDILRWGYETGDGIFSDK